MATTQGKTAGWVFRIASRGYSLTSCYGGETPNSTATTITIPDSPWSAVTLHGCYRPSAARAASSLKVQLGNSLFEFVDYGSEVQCENILLACRSPQSFVCPSRLASLSP